MLVRTHVSLRLPVYFDMNVRPMPCTDTGRSLFFALLRAVNLGGDCDSVGAVTGALAGAIYGYDEFVKGCYEWVKKWDEMRIAIRAYKLFHKKPIKST